MADDECPLCMEALPLDVTRCVAYDCCGKTICRRCQKRQEELDPFIVVDVDGLTTLADGAKSGESLATRCPFCRGPVPSSVKESRQTLARSTDRGEPSALYCRGRNAVDEGRSQEGWADVYAAAAQGYVYALSYLGSYAVATPKRFLDAIDCLRAAAARGEAAAMMTLGATLLLGAPRLGDECEALRQQCRFLQDPDFAIDLFERPPRPKATKTPSKGEATSEASRSSKKTTRTTTSQRAVAGAASSPAKLEKIFSRPSPVSPAAAPTLARAASQEAPTAVAPAASP